MVIFYISGLQIARLESLVDEAKQSAEFQRAEVARANKELMLAEKQLAEMKVELRMARKETKIAEERVKQLQVSEFSGPAEPCNQQWAKLTALANLRRRYLIFPRLIR